MEVTKFLEHGVSHGWSFPPSELARALTRLSMLSTSSLTFRIPFLGVDRPCRMNARKVLNFAADGILAWDTGSPSGKRVTYPRQRYHTIWRSLTLSFSSMIIVKPWPLASSNGVNLGSSSSFLVSIKNRNALKPLGDGGLISSFTTTSRKAEWSPSAATMRSAVWHEPSFKVIDPSGEPPTTCAPSRRVTGFEPAASSLVAIRRSSLCKSTRCTDQQEAPNFSSAMLKSTRFTRFKESPRIVSHWNALQARARSKENPRLLRTRTPFGAKESAAPTSPVKADFSKIYKEQYPRSVSLSFLCLLSQSGWLSPFFHPLGTLKDYPAFSWTRRWRVRVKALTIPRHHVLLAEVL